MKHLRLFEEFENADSYVADMIKYPGLTCKPAGINTIMVINDEEVGEFRFAGVDNFYGKRYLIEEMIYVEKKYRRKGIYSAVIDAAIKYAKSKGLAGVISTAYDMDIGQKRSDDNDNFWENLVRQGKAKKVESEWSPGEFDYVTT